MLKEIRTKVLKAVIKQNPCRKESLGRPKTKWKDFSKKECGITWQRLELERKING